MASVELKVECKYGKSTLDLTKVNVIWDNQGELDAVIKQVLHCRCFVLNGCIKNCGLLDAAIKQQEFSI